MPTAFLNCSVAIDGQDDAMTDTPDGMHRSLTTAAPDHVRLVESDELDGDEGMMELRMPVASTGAVRNEGDDPLTRRELQGMAEQLNSNGIGVFPEHGMSDAVDREPMSQFEKLGYWADAEIQTGASDDDEDLLVATARMPDPDTLPNLGSYRQALGILKEQAKRSIPIESSIGWRQDDAYPGGNDLMEVSIVGIGADPRTNTAQGADAGVMARSAVAAGADPDDFLDRVERAVEEAREADTDEARPFGPPGEPDKWADFDACVADVEDWDGIDNPEAYCGAIKADSEQAADGDTERATYEVGDTTVDISPPEPMVNAAREALEAKRQFDDLSDCGTGVGEERARQIIADEVGPEVIDEVAAYLTSHEEDVQGIDDPPTDWGDEEWLGTYNSDDPRCGPVQYALWGGTATGSALDWSQRKANEVAEAKGEELPYDRTTDMTDDDTAGDDAGTTDEQTADGTDADGETTQRAPEDVTEEDLLTFTAMHLDGMDESDLGEAIDAADASYIGECDPEALADLVSTATGAEYGDVVDAMDDLMAGGDEEQEYEDGEKEDDEEMDDEDEAMSQSADADETEDADRSADTDADDGAESEERDADTDADDGDSELLEEIERQLDGVDDARQALRDGDIEVRTTDEADADDAADDEQHERTTDSTDLRGQTIRGIDS